MYCVSSLGDRVLASRRLRSAWNPRKWECGLSKQNVVISHLLLKDCSCCTDWSCVCLLQGWLLLYHYSRICTSGPPAQSSICGIWWLRIYHDPENKGCVHGQLFLWAHTGNPPFWPQDITREKMCLSRFQVCHLFFKFITHLSLVKTTPKMAFKNHKKLQHPMQYIKNPIKR